MSSAYQSTRRKMPQLDRCACLDAEDSARQRIEGHLVVGGVGVDSHPRAQGSGMTAEHLDEVALGHAEA